MDFETFLNGLETGHFPYLCDVILPLHTDGALCYVELPSDVCRLIIGALIQLIYSLLPFGELGRFGPNLKLRQFGKRESLQQLLIFSERFSD
jgi:hypothetical protein